MAQVELSRSADRSRSMPLGLFVASFLFAFQNNAMLLACPWQVFSLGGRSLAVGMVGALSLGFYMIFCFFIGSRFCRLGAKSLMMTSTFMVGSLLIGMALAPNVPVLLLLVAVQGMMLSGFWPPVMGWISTGVEGSSLNRRLGFFNLSWSLGAIIGTWMSGVLYAVSHSLPFMVAAGAAFLACVIIFFVPPAKPQTQQAVLATENVEEPKDLSVFLWLWRVGVLTDWVAYGILRVPIASLIKGMSLGASLHAMSSAGTSMIMMCMFFLLGRFRFWHYRFSLVIVSQLLLAIMMVGLTFGTNARQLLFFVFASTPALAFAYSSHLFYSVSGGRNRRTGAAEHEILLAIGFCIGSLGGGALGQIFGVRMTYSVVAGVILAAMVVETVIYCSSRFSRRAVRPVGDVQVRLSPIRTSQ